MDEIDTAPWSSLAARLRVLRRQVTAEERLREGHHLQSDWEALVLTLPVESSPEEQRQVRVALDLLQTLWTLDRGAWRRVMIEVVGVDMPTRLVLPEDAAAALVVVVSVKYDKFPSQVNHARWATLLDPELCLTEDEASIKWALMEFYGQHNMMVSLIPLRLQFLVFGMATSVVETYLTKAVDMVEAVRDLLRGRQAPMERVAIDERCAAFTVDSLELSLAPYEMTSGTTRQVLRLHALGIRFHQLNLRIIQHEVDSEVDKGDTADRDRMFTVLLSPPHGEAVEGDGPDFFLETLVLDRADLVQFSAACTALETTQIVKNLQLHMVFTFDSPTERWLKWEWLTRAIFARSSRTSIKHLAIIQPEIELSDVNAVASALQAINTEASGAGDHVLETLVMSCEASRPETLEAIPRLLELVGLNLEALSIYFWLGSIPTGLIQGIQRTCPNLLFLDLSSVELESMDVLLDAYERGGCYVRSLALHNVDVANESVTAFALALCDQRHRASRVLRELCVDAVGIDNALDQANLDAFITLLGAPGSPLEYLELRVSEPLLSENRTRFIAHHNTWGSGVAAPLSTSSKTAFLAVCKPRLRGRNGNDEATVSPAASQMVQLDEHILSLIFQFAATRSWRTVHFAEP